jgi:lysophospholipase L1-like esterase
MKINFVVILILVILAILLSGCNKVIQQTQGGINTTAPKTNVSNEVVFLGDSITAIPDWNSLFGVSYIINAGVGGSKTDDVISRVSSVISSKPRKLFLMIGVNDLSYGKDASYVFTNIETIVNKIKSESPDTIIYLQSVLPVNFDISKDSRPNYGQEIIMLNDKLKSFADGNKVIFIDLYPSFCGSDNKMYAKYTADGVHPNSDGYAVWKNLISQYIK